MDRINTRRARAAGAGVRVGVVVAIAVAVCEGVAEAVTVAVMVGVVVDDGVGVGNPGRLGIWQASRKISENAMTSFIFVRMLELYPLTKVILRASTRG